MKIKLDLMVILGKICEQVGVTKPFVISKESYYLKHCVSVGFDGSVLPYELKSGASPIPNCFYGDDAHSVDVAEHKAIMSLVGSLMKTYDIEIHDTSHYKIKTCESKFLDILTAMDNFVERFNYFLSKYVACTDSMKLTLESTKQKYEKLSDEVIIKVSAILEESKTSIGDLKHKLINVGIEDYDDIMAASATTKKIDDSKGTPIVWEISAKETLAELLICIGLDEANYENKITDVYHFIGVCKVNLGKCYGPEPTGSTRIEGEKMNTPYDAENSAAAAAIKALEHIRGVEIVDFNYDNLLVQRKMLCSLIRHRSKLDMLFSEGNKSWTSMITNIQEFIDGNYGLSQSIPLSAEGSVEWTALMNCISDLEENLSSVKQEHYSAVSAMASAVD